MYEDQPVKAQGGLSTEHAAAAVVLGCLAFLIAVRMGFTGINAGGVGVNLS